MASSVLTCNGIHAVSPWTTFSFEVARIGVAPLTVVTVFAGKTLSAAFRALQSEDVVTIVLGKLLTPSYSVSSVKSHDTIVF